MYYFGEGLLASLALTTWSSQEEVLHENLPLSSESLTEELDSLIDSRPEGNKRYLLDCWSLYEEPSLSSEEQEDDDDDEQQLESSSDGEISSVMCAADHNSLPDTTEKLQLFIDPCLLVVIKGFSWTSRPVT